MVSGIKSSAYTLHPEHAGERVGGEMTSMDLHWVHELLRINRVPVYAAYGLVFILLGVSVAVQSLNQSRMQLGKHLWMLSVFGLTHGFTEWADVFIPIQGAYLSPYWVAILEFVRLGLMLTSFLFLALFAFHLVVGPDRGRLSVRVTVLLGSAGLLVMTGIGLLHPKVRKSVV